MDWFNFIIQIAVALIPGIVLCYYVYTKDRVEKEPIFRLLLTLVGGVFSALIVISLGGYVDDFIDWLFRGQAMIYVFDDGTRQYTGMYYLYQVLHWFVGVALVEETAKFIYLFLLTNNEENFDCMFDGMLYAIFVALGFAMFENVFYVMKFGVEVGFARAVTAVPGHMFDAVVMGYFYSHWHITGLAKHLEASLVRKGVLRYRGPKICLARFGDCILWPTVIHGIYDFLCSVNTSWSMGVFCIFIGSLYIFGFARIRKSSRLDAKHETYAMAVVLKKYPELREMLAE